MPRHPGNILMIDDDPDVRLSARLLLKRRFGRIRTIEHPRKMEGILSNEAFDVLLLDMNFARNATNGAEGFSWLSRIKRDHPDLDVILITAFGDVEMAVQAIKAGATDFILKPWENDRLIATVSTVMELRQSRREVVRLRERQRQLSADMDSRYHSMIGRCAAMQKVFGIIAKVSATDANVLILGANGTGKELVARALHRGSGRSQEVFISVDMGAVPEHLFESEFFGHGRGAFTGADEKRTGRMEVASGGTLFLDEIGNLPPPQQGKLLRALEERIVTPLGANRPRPIDIRLVCATNTAIYERVARGGFRPDLLYRINTVEIHLPPLCERGEDILLLADFFSAHYCRKYRKADFRLTGDARSRLLAYHWPGNVRELRHAIERAVIMTEGGDIGPEAFSFTATAGTGPPPACDNLDRLEKETIKRVLVQSGGNISRAAGSLGLTRAALYRRLQKYGL